LKLLIINYHYVTPKVYDRGIYPRSPKEFDSDIKKLLDKGWEPISSNELENITLLKAKKGKKLFLITLDDALKCQFVYAYPILESYGIKGVFCIPTAILLNKALTVHKIQYIRSKIDDMELLGLVRKSFPNIEKSQIDESKLKEQYPYDNPEDARLKFMLNFILRGAKKESFVNDILEKIEDQNSFFKNTYMDQEAIGYLAHKGCIGYHGNTHNPLPWLSPNELVMEFQTSIELIRNTFKIDRISIISYPYGGPEAVSESVLSAVKATGFSFGITMDKGINYLEDIIETPYSLKRISINDLNEWI
jgi:peptidoglycan/xylan/chitin deacetylase (PgdA/CDA1 family)